MRYTKMALLAFGLGLLLGLVVIAAEIKALHKLSFVDCIAAALAELRSSILVTADRDFQKLGRRIQVLWLARS